LPDNFSLLISGSWLYYLVVAVLLCFIAIFYYRITIPVISKPKKYLLLSLRALILLVLALLLFSPIANFSFKTTETPVNYFFIDKSESMSFNDGMKRETIVKKFLSDLVASPLGKNAKVFSFSNSIDTLDLKKNAKLKFDGAVTNFEQIFKFAKEKKLKNASISIISDGVVTDGANPAFIAEKLELPVFSVAIGDSSAKKDILVENVVFNEYQFVGSKSPISASIQIAGFPNTDIKVTLTEDGRPVDNQVVSIDEDGYTSTILNYSPRTTGIKKMAVSVQNFPSEANKQNNIYPFFVTVLDNKKKVLIVSGAPTPDVSFIKNALSGDSNLTVRSMTFDASTTPLEKDINSSVFDSTGVLFLVNYPSKAIPQKIFDDIVKLISERNLPFFILINQYSDMALLKKIEPYLPVTIQTGAGVDFEGQIGLAEGAERNPLFYSAQPGSLKEWENLPPVFIPNIRANARPESQVIAFVKLNSKVLPNPLIVSRNFGFKRSLAIIAGDIWKWKLKAKKANLFDDFLFGSAKWLGAVKDKKRFSIRTNKRFYTRNEQVEFIAEAYTESFDPLSDAEVVVNLTSQKGKTTFSLSPLGAGIYQSVYKPENSGDYSFTSTATLDGKPFGSDVGSFNIGDINIEFVDPYTDAGFLRNLSSLTDGQFYSNSDYLKLFDDLAKFNKESSTEVKNSVGYNLWTNPYLLISLILLLSIEWFLRKREGMS
jgi:hypothetical protein